MPDEPTLLQRVARGESAAVRLVLDRYGALVWSIIRRQIDPSAAEELVHEIFVEIWKNANRYRPERASEATFITTIARRRLIDHRRRVGRRPRQEELEESFPEETDAPDPVEIADEARVAAEAFRQLKPVQRQVLQYAIIDGLSHTEISETLQLPLGTVKSHARRGLERVRSLLASRSGCQTEEAGS